MACEICGRSSCIASFHSLAEQNEADGSKNESHKADHSDEVMKLIVKSHTDNIVESLHSMVEKATTAVSKLFTLLKQNEEGSDVLTIVKALLPEHEDIARRQQMEADCTVICSECMNCALPQYTWHAWGHAEFSEFYQVYQHKKLSSPSESRECGANILRKAWDETHKDKNDAE